ncbi:(2Fe-2S) ferredoxin domain-containing protein [Synergistaceae bacterium OttesenSCG-928-I11]|nr:(2Fe-2S) ferredoxin domain-containing protein [Synergistaceae bacterium OttesenSCG-928-I11]
MLEIDVCIGSSCHVRGSYNVVQAIQQYIEERSLHNAVDLRTTFCTRECHNAGVSVVVDGTIHRVMPERAGEFLDEITKDL